MQGSGSCVEVRLSGLKMLVSDATVVSSRCHDPGFCVDLESRRSVLEKFLEPVLI